MVDLSAGMEMLGWIWWGVGISAVGLGVEISGVEIQHHHHLTCVSSLHEIGWPLRRVVKNEIWRTKLMGPLMLFERRWVRVEQVYSRLASPAARAWERPSAVVIEG